ncbi:putative type IV pilin [Clostridium sp. DL-VIII]|uniref:prepilin-type N-terminal cleavage/methylation domain-containing protein n=1 Tax=Clostridium sp. DL-VIII TaxID=641107 RepID=UPI00023B0554|nr:prepilin-type N-terminal cleavage/methylation domain-containing protein [Clostridium sp. DL-VIII]EHJ01425.1 putative type IV pilin [Clostridium sp. DL-VIII]
MNSLLNKRKNELQTNKKKGFTLVELIIVIAIIAILVALAIPKFGAVIENSNEKADQATAKNIATIVAQEIANGTALTPGPVTTDDDDVIGSKLDGTKTPKAKKAGEATTFTYAVDATTGNITVSYTNGKEVYPDYAAGSK